MTENDKPMFAKMLSKLMVLTGQPKPQVDVIEIWFDFLKEIPIETIGHGITKYLDDPQAAQFPPTAAKIRAFSKSLTLYTDFKPTPDAVIAAARDPKTPLGVIARIKIGSWDLDNRGSMPASAHSFYLRERAQEVIQDLHTTQARALNGEYTRHELTIMAKYSVDPEQPFANGLPKPNREALARIGQIRAETGLKSKTNKNLSLPTG
jgi:hypothetical protein